MAHLACHRCRAVSVQITRFNVLLLFTCTLPLLSLGWWGFSDIPSSESDLRGRSRSKFRLQMESIMKISVLFFGWFFLAFTYHEIVANYLDYYNWPWLSAPFSACL